MNSSSSFTSSWEHWKSIATHSGSGHNHQLEWKCKCLDLHLQNKSCSPQMLHPLGRVSLWNNNDYSCSSQICHKRIVWADGCNAFNSLESSTISARLLNLWSSNGWCSLSSGWIHQSSRSINLNTCFSIPMTPINCVDTASSLLAWPDLFLLSWNYYNRWYDAH